MAATTSPDEQKVLAEIQKMNEETRKFVDEQHKLQSEAALNSKKTKWYEFTMLLAVVAATIAATKIFL